MTKSSTATVRAAIRKAIAVGKALTIQTQPTGAETMHEIDYTNKPSITTLRAAIRKAAAAGKTFIVLTWGENQITLERVNYSGGYRPQWVGRGWIGRNGGQDLANELEISNRTGAPAGRLIVKHIGA